MCEDKGHNIFHMTVQDECKHIKKEHPRTNIRYRCKFCSKTYQIRHAALCHVPKCPKVAAAAAAPPPEPSGSGSNDGPSSPPIPESEGQACPDCGEKAAGTRQQPQTRVSKSIFSDEETRIMLECELRYLGDSRIAAKMAADTGQNAQANRDRRRNATYLRDRNQYLRSKV
nr:unnamed protein product [Callosobruchus analis]CAI5867899.1 unnamed protein product [Callosobruchus analis]